LAFGGLLVASVVDAATTTTATTADKLVPAVVLTPRDFPSAAESADRVDAADSVFTRFVAKLQLAVESTNDAFSVDVPISDYCYAADVNGGALSAACNARAVQFLQSRGYKASVADSTVLQNSMLNAPRRAERRRGDNYGVPSTTRGDFCEIVLYENRKFCDAAKDVDTRVTCLVAIKSPSGQYFGTNGRPFQQTPQLARCIQISQPQATTGPVESPAGYTYDPATVTETGAYIFFAPSSSPAATTPPTPVTAGARMTVSWAR